MNRIHSFDKPQSRIDAQYADEIRSFERLGVTTDPAAAGTSEVHGKPMSPAEIQAANPPPTPKGVKREGAGGYVYPKSFEVL